ncbi:MAG: hypothetical protein ACYDEQ_06940 [Desulfocucumaceae bacterium]
MDIVDCITLNILNRLSPEAVQKAPDARRGKALSGGVLIVRWSEKPLPQRSRWTFSTAS